MRVTKKMPVHETLALTWHCVTTPPGKSAAKVRLSERKNKFIWVFPPPPHVFPHPMRRLFPNPVFMDKGHIFGKSSANVWWINRKALILQSNNKEKDKTMARPIKETPILFGEEARQFEMRMLNPQSLSSERKERIQRDYEFLRARCVNCSFW